MRTWDWGSLGGGFLRATCPAASRAQSKRSHDVSTRSDEHPMDRWLLFYTVLLGYSAHTSLQEIRAFPQPNYDDFPESEQHGPEQIHIAYGDSPTKMTVMWATSAVDELASSIVYYGRAPRNYSLKARGEHVLFTEGNPQGLKFVHRVGLEVQRTRVYAG